MNASNFKPLHYSNKSTPLCKKYLYISPQCASQYYSTKSTGITIVISQGSAKAEVMERGNSRLKEAQR